MSCLGIYLIYLANLSDIGGVYIRLYIYLNITFYDIPTIIPMFDAYITILITIAIVSPFVPMKWSLSIPAIYLSIYLSIYITIIYIYTL